MKQAVIALSLLMTCATWADRSSLIDHDDEWNMFSKFEISSSEIDENNAFWGGLSIGGLLNDQLGVGIAGQILVDSAETDSLAVQDISSGDVYYGGAYIEYVFTPDNLVYLSLDLLLGGGDFAVKSAGNNELSSSFMIAEPGVNLMINITKTSMFGLGASYRFTDDLDVMGIDEQALSTWSGTVFLRFTQF